MTVRYVRMLAVFGFAFALVVGVRTSLGPRGSVAQTITQVRCDRVCLQVKADRHLVLMGEFGQDGALQASLRDLSAAGPPVIRVVQDTYNRWTGPLTVHPKITARPAEIRWRAVHLLGSLGNPDAIPVLFDIARKPLPEPKMDEHAFRDEVRIRLRAVVGLEKLKAVDELKQLNEEGGLLRNPTAASLFVLGVNVGGVSRVDVKRALAEDIADHKDHNPSKGRAPQPTKPGRERINPKRRPDTPSVLIRENNPRQGKGGE